MRRGETQKVNINQEYIRKYFAEHNLALQTESKGIGKSRSYLHAMFKLGSMDKTGMLLLCHNTGMDFEKATALPVKKEATISIKNTNTHSEPAITQGVTKEELRELTELVISYMQDLGKIHSDTLRELRETRTALKEVLDKESRELHDLSIYIKNSGAEARKSRETTNNNLNTIYNYIHKKGEQQLVK